MYPVALFHKMAEEMEEISCVSVMFAHGLKNQSLRIGCEIAGNLRVFTRHLDV